MSKVDFSSLRPRRPLTRRETARYRRWVRYLKDSKLSEEEIHKRASQYALKREPPND